MTGEEITRRLVDFARKWSLYDGSERAEAQTFLNELFACYGTDRQEAGARFEAAQKGKFLDLVWPRSCLIEMKRPSETPKLANHREQALNYWRNASDAAHNVPAPRFVVLCSFRRFEIWEPGAYPTEPRAEFDLVDLPDRIDALMFLAHREPVFVSSQEAVTRQAVSLMTGLYHQLGDRFAASPDVRRNFLLQTVWCLFAEDLGQLEGHRFTRIAIRGNASAGSRASYSISARRCAANTRSGSRSSTTESTKAPTARCAPHIAISIWPSSPPTGGAVAYSTTFVSATGCCLSATRPSALAKSRTPRSDVASIVRPVMADSRP